MRSRELKILYGGLGDSYLFFFGKKSHKNLQKYFYLASESSDKEASNDETNSTSKEIDQISTLTQSLATLTSEKSRLEQSFQEDKKKLRAEVNDKNKTIETLRAELKSANEKSRTEVEESKSKLIIERHNR